MKRGFVFVILLCLLIGYTFFYYYNVFARTGAVVLLEEKKGNQLIVRFANGKEKNISAPEIITPLLEEGKQYFVVIYENKLRKPFLAKIEPMDR
jgi:hypothetical protein